MHLHAHYVVFMQSVVAAKYQRACVYPKKVKSSKLEKGVIVLHMFTIGNARTEVFVGV